MLIKLCALCVLCGEGVFTPVFSALFACSAVKVFLSRFSPCALCALWWVRLIIGHHIDHALLPGAVLAPAEGVDRGEAEEHGETSQDAQ